MTSIICYRILLSILFNVKLKSTGDNSSPCLSPLLVSKESENSPQYPDLLLLNFIKFTILFGILIILS